ncbi:MAG: gluzincin family metallopeptidase [Planctomycetota bacterium]|jgi:hypothetical protein
MTARRFALALTVAPALLAVPATGQTHGRGSGDEAFWAPAVPPRAHYSITCAVDPATGRLRGLETIRLTNSAPRAIHRLALDWSAEGDVAVTVTMGATSAETVATATGTRTTRLLELPAPLPPGQLIELELEFVEKFGISEDQAGASLTDWHPRLWWGYPTHDDYDVDVQMPPGWALATSGRLDEKSGRWRATGVRSFGLFVGEGLEIAEGRSGPVAIRCFHTPAAEPCARLLLETAVDAVTYYRDHFGMYPHASLSIIPGGSRPMGGYPVATAMVAIHGQERFSERPRIHWQWITAHEIGHQYWLEHVLSAERGDWGWLMIGLGIHADRGYCLARGLGLDKHRAIMDRYVAGVREHLDTTAERPYEQLAQVKFDFNNVVVHGKGYAIISALDCVLGSETFEGVVRRCLDEFGGRRLSRAEFQAVCEQEGGQDLDWFFDQWVRTNRYLSCRIAAQECSEQGGGYLSEVRVERLGTLRMPVPVEARFADGTTRRAFTDRLSDVAVLRFASSAPLDEAVVDPDGVLPLVVPPPEITTAELGAMISSLPWTGAGGTALRLYHKADEAGWDNRGAWTKLGMTLYDGRFYPEALEAFRRAEGLADKDSSWWFASCVWQGHVLDLLDRRDEALPCYQRALADYDGASMRHDQYGMKLDRAWVEKRLKEPFARE